MKTIWKIVALVAVTLLVIGIICFSLSQMLGADLVRVADAVFNRYDLTQTILNFQAFFGQFFGFLTFA